MLAGVNVATSQCGFRSSSQRTSFGNCQSTCLSAALAPCFWNQVNMVGSSSHFFWHWNRHCWRSTPHHCQIWYMRGNGGVPFTSALHGKYKSQNKFAPCRFIQSESSQRQSAGTVRPQVLRACSA